MIRLEIEMLNAVKNPHMWAPRKTVSKNPELGPRLEKIKKEELDDRSRIFIDSLSDFYQRKGGLTTNQLASFEKIESRFSFHEKAKLKLWTQEYLEHHLEKTKIIAAYYETTGYYTSLAHKILREEGFIPSKKDYERMVKNKYAARVLEAAQADPKFNVNEMVQLRSTIGNNSYERNLQSLRSRICFVLANDLPIHNATAGCKRYKVLPMGASDPLELDEKHLMKPNKRGKYS